MRKLVYVLVGLVACLTVVGWAGSASAGVGRSAAPPAAIGNSSVTGNYSVFMTFHDAQFGQEGNGAGTYSFDGNGNLGGVLSENSRCIPSGPNPCTSGNGVNIRAAVSGRYTIYPDASASLDICLHITNGIGPAGGPPVPMNQYVEVMWEGSFSAFFFHGRFIQTLLKPITLGNTCANPGVDWQQTPNVTGGELEKV